MTFLTLSAQEKNQLANDPTQSELTHTVIYRGATYLTSLQRMNKAERQEARLKELVGKRLNYRANTYEVVPSFIVKTELPTTFKRLVYRGMTYMKAV